MGDIYSISTHTLTFLKATISPSQPGVGRKDYSTWIAVKSDAVETAYCSCPAGKGRSCSHISAIIYAVCLAWSSGLGGETCTDKVRVWGKGANVAAHDRLEDISFDRPRPFTTIAKINTTTNNDRLSPTKQFLDHEELKEHVQKSTVGSLWECKGSLLNMVLNPPEIEEQKKQENNHEDHNINSSIPVTLPLSCGKCETFYGKYINISQDKRKALEHMTTEQNNNLWMDSRKIRITSSRASSIPKSSRGDPNKFVTNQIYTRFKGCSATRHGQKFEPVARDWYTETSGQTINKCGLKICENEPYIAASPDGQIDENTIVEIKCPTKPLQELVDSGKYDVISKDGSFLLSKKGRNGYYYQVQLAMYCTKATLCKFIVWTAESQCVLDVPYDEGFLVEILPRIRKFFFEHFLPRVSDEVLAGRLKFSGELKKFCC